MSGRFLRVQQQKEHLWFLPVPKVLVFSVCPTNSPLGLLSLLQSCISGESGLREGCWVSDPVNVNTLTCTSYFCYLFHTGKPAGTDMKWTTPESQSCWKKTVSAHQTCIYEVIICYAHRLSMSPCHHANATFYVLLSAIGLTRRIFKGVQSTHWS